MSRLLRVAITKTSFPEFVKCATLVEGKWTDSDGRKANFTKWDINEPNNVYNQDFAAFWYPGANWATKIPKAWDDVGGHEKVSIFCDVSAVCDLGELNVLVERDQKV